MPPLCAYLHMKPAVTLFADLDAKLDGGEASRVPAIGGLTVTKSTDALGPVATAFSADVASFQAVLKAANATPEITIKGGPSDYGGVP